MLSSRIYDNTKFHNIYSIYSFYYIFHIFKHKYQLDLQSTTYAKIYSK